MKILMTFCMVFLHLQVLVCEEICPEPEYNSIAACEPHCRDDDRHCTETQAGISSTGIRCCLKCFPASAKVHLENGKIATMSELGIGDAVKSVSPNGNIIYTKVKGFLHKLPTVTFFYNSVTTSRNFTINASGKHLIYARKSKTEKFSPVFTNQLLVGNEVLVVQNNDLTPTEVKDVSYSKMQGVYAPLTEEGNVVVDGILASCYAVVDHDIAQAAMKPIRWYADVMKLVFGDENGVSTYVSVAQNLGRWVLPQGSEL